MDGFIFHPKLEGELEWLLNHPLKVPSPLCFYGIPAQGKTTFAKYFAERIAQDVVYYDANAHLGNKHDASKILKEITIRQSVVAPLIMDEQKRQNPWQWAFIIDEWHNFSDDRQDSYKVAFEKMSENHRCLFILCVNTDAKNTIRKVLTPAIHSRCHKVRFDILQSQVDEMVKLTLKAYPMLDEDFIRSVIPDWRAINRRVEMMS